MKNLIVLLIFSILFSIHLTAQSCLDYNRYEGDNLQLTVANNYNSYQWYFEDNALLGEKTATLSLDSLLLADAGRYHCEMVLSHNTTITCFLVSVNAQGSGQLEAEIVQRELMTDLSGKSDAEKENISNVLLSLNLTRKDSCNCKNALEIWEGPEGIDIEETVKKAKTSLDEEGIGFNYFLNTPKPRYCVLEGEYGWYVLPPSQSTDSVLIAVVDNGFDINNTEVQGKVWRNPYAEDPFLCAPNPNSSGYNAASPEETISPHRHGTAVASIIATHTNAADNVKMMNIQVKKRAKKSTAFEFTCGLRYAIENKVDIINISMGYYGSKCPLLEKTMKMAQDSSILVVTSAGNGGKGKKNHWPSNFSKIGFDNVIAVGAVDGERYRKNYSSDAAIFAPGHNLLCHRPNNKGERLVSGTSFAAPFVTAIAAWIMLDNKASPSEIISSIYDDFAIAGQTPDVPKELDVPLLAKSSQPYGDVDISVSDIFFEEDIFEATNSVTGTSSINPESSIIFRAGNQIKLDSGFHAARGSHFLATIAACNSATPPSRQAVLGEEEIVSTDFYQKTTPTSAGMTVVPNPFSSRTSIQFSIDNATSVKLSVYNALGQGVAQLENGFLDSGMHVYDFDAKQLPNGIYFVLLQSQGDIFTTKVVLSR